MCCSGISHFCTLGVDISDHQTAITLHVTIPTQYYVLTFSGTPNWRQLQVGSTVRVHCTLLVMWKSLVQIPKQTPKHCLKLVHNLLLPHTSQSIVYSQTIIRRNKIKATFKLTKNNFIDFKFFKFIREVFLRVHAMKHIGGVEVKVNSFLTL